MTSGGPGSSVRTSRRVATPEAVRHLLGGYREYEPPWPVASFAESVWVYRTPDSVERATHRVLPDLAFNIALTCRRDQIGRIEGMSVRLSGPKTRPMMASFDGRHETVAIKVKLEWVSAVVPIDPMECANTAVDLSEVSPALAGALADVLEGSRGVEQVATGLVARLATWPHARRGKAPPSAAALDLVRRADGQISIERLASLAAVSTRHLRRMVRRDMGMSLKAYARTARLLKAMRLGDAWGPGSHRTWAGIAADAGFCDQSHLIRECLALTGHTPEQLRRERQSEPGARGRWPLQ